MQSARQVFPANWVKKGKRTLQKQRVLFQSLWQAQLWDGVYDGATLTASFFSNHSGAPFFIPHDLVGFLP